MMEADAHPQWRQMPKIEADARSGGLCSRRRQMPAVAAGDTRAFASWCHVGGNVPCFISPPSFGIAWRPSACGNQAGVGTALQK